MVKIRFKSLILSMVLTLLFISIPSKGFAEDNLDKHIKQVKTLFEIGDDYKDFNRHEYSNYDGRKITSLSWRFTNTDVGVDIDEEGNIFGYWKNRYSTSNSTDRNLNIYKFPKITREQGEKTAREFIKKLYPDLVDTTKLRKESNLPHYYRGNLQEYGYNFVEVRNGIEFNQNVLYVDVDTQSGEVTRLNMNWEKGLDFPDTKNIISKEEAKEIYINNIDLELLYKARTVDKNIKSYLGYNILDTDKTVDAITGDMVSTSYKPTHPVYSSSLYGNLENIPVEEESKLISSKKIISKEEAGRILLDTFNLGENYEVNGYRLKGDKENDIYIWDVMVMKHVGNHGSGTNSRVNAKTGEIVDFSDPGAPESDTEEPKYSREELLKKAEEIVKDNNPDKYKEVEYVEDQNENLAFDENHVSVFSFLRKTNDLRIEYDGFMVVLNNITGDILSYSYNWSDLEFESPENVIDKNKAKEVIFKDKELELEYQKLTEGKENKDVKLVYDFKDKYIPIDAQKAEIVDSSQDLADKFIVKEYKDIENSFAKTYIEKLQNLIFLFEGNEFKPKQEVTQKEFLRLLSQTKDRFLHEDLNYMYEDLIRVGVVKQEEKNLEAKVTREEAIKYIVRAFGQEPMDNMTDIYKLEYKDADKVSPNLKGHLAIAKGLGIISGEGNFRPKDILTREEAVVLIYNILNRN